MTRRPHARLLLLATLLCSACTPDAPQAPTPPAPEVAAPVLPMPTVPAPSTTPPAATPAAAPDLRGWWDRPEALGSLGLTVADAAPLASELRRLERSYQTAQRQLYTVRVTQLEMLRDRRIPSADIRRFHRENLQKLLVSMRDDDISARLWVREHLSVDYQARVLERSPQFFGLRWFRAAEVPE